MKQLIVDRSHWSHGRKGSCMLFDSDDRMLDIFGFVALQLGGGRRKDIDKAGAPSDVPRAFRKFLEVFEDKNAYLVDEITSANDSKTLTDERREARLIVLFREMGVELSFTGKYTEWTCCDSCRPPRAHKASTGLGLGLGLSLSR